MNNDKLQALKFEREKLADAKTKKAALLAALEASPEWKDAVTQIAFSENEVNKLEAEIREEALDEFKATGTKKPHESVQVQFYSIVKEYNEAAAREWCFQNFRPALTMDTKTFEKAVKDGQIPDSIAQSDVEPRVKIATKL